MVGLGDLRYFVNSSYFGKKKVKKWKTLCLSTVNIALDWLYLLQTTYSRQILEESTNASMPKHNPVKYIESAKRNFFQNLGRIFWFPRDSVVATEATRSTVNFTSFISSLITLMATYPNPAAILVIVPASMTVVKIERTSHGKKINTLCEFCLYRWNFRRELILGRFSLFWRGSYIYRRAMISLLL